MPWGQTKRKTTSWGRGGPCKRLKTHQFPGWPTGNCPLCERGMEFSLIGVSRGVNEPTKASGVSYFETSLWAEMKQAKGKPHCGFRFLETNPGTLEGKDIGSVGFHLTRFK